MAGVKRLVSGLIYMGTLQSIFKKYHHLQSFSGSGRVGEVFSFNFLDLALQEKASAAHVHI